MPPAKPIPKRHGVPPAKAPEVSKPAPAKKPAPSQAPPKPSPKPPPKEASKPPDSKPLRRRLPPLSPTPVEFPRNEAEAMNNVLCRDVVHPETQDDVPADPTVEVLSQLVSGIVNGTDLNPVKDTVQRILSHQRDKAELIASVLQNHEFHRVAEWTRVRAENERRLYKASLRGDLTTAESIAFMRTANQEINAFVDRVTLLSKNNQQALDTGVVEKVDTANIQEDPSALEHFKGTTPHGREIIRRRLFALKKGRGDT